MTAVGYLRQSRRADQDVALSPESQRHDIEALAARDGEELLAIYEDLGRSGGRGKEKLRPGYRDLLAAIEEGRASTVYTKTITRLGRSVPELYRVLTLAESRGVRIVTAKEGVMDPKTPMGKVQFGMLAVFSEFERDLAVERAKDNVAERRRRGEKMGRRAYGELPGQDPQDVLDAWHRAGSLNGAASLLNDAGIKSALGRKWTATSVRLVVERLEPKSLPRREQRGAKASSPGNFALYRLLVCPHDGRVLTAGRHARNGTTVDYRCGLGDVDKAHPRPYRVMEKLVLPWVREQLEAKTGVRSTVVYASSGAAEQRAALLEEKRRTGKAYAAGALEDADFEAAMARVDAALAELPEEGAEDAVVTLRRVGRLVHFDAEPAVVNAELRKVVDRIVLGADMRPVRLEIHG